MSYMSELCVSSIGIRRAGSIGRKIRVGTSMTGTFTLQLLGLGVLGKATLVS